MEYFVSYYDYYQPESYIPEKDQYIEKDAHINPKIEQHRMAATASLMSREDVIVVASVSCIYGLGNPANYRDLGFQLGPARFARREILRGSWRSSTSGTTSTRAGEVPGEGGCHRPGPGLRGPDHPG